VLLDSPARSYGVFKIAAAVLSVLTLRCPAV
jgi:hypothetical protein